MNLKLILSFCNLRRFSVIAGLLAATISPAALAQDSNYGCKVLLCLANPQGPRAVAECVDDINRLYRDLHRGRPMPRCEMAQANASAGTVEAVQRRVWHDECPAGTSSLALGARAVQGSAPPGGVAVSYDPYSYGTPFVGIGDTSGEVAGEFGTFVQQKVCVGNRVGTAIVYSGGDGGAESFDIYDRIVVIDPAPTPDVIDVLINGQLNNRVRY